LIADLADLEELLDIELVDRFDVHRATLGPPAQAGNRNFKCRDFRGC
jgi:hypothetical protein